MCFTRQVKKNDVVRYFIIYYPAELVVFFRPKLHPLKRYNFIAGLDKPLWLSLKLLHFGKYVQTAASSGHMSCLCSVGMSWHYVRVIADQRAPTAWPQTDGQPGQRTTFEGEDSGDLDTSRGTAEPVKATTFSV